MSRSALITDATSSIGFAIAEKMISRNVQMIITGRHQQSAVYPPSGRRLYAGERGRHRVPL